MSLERKPAVGRRDVEPHGAIAIGARQRNPARLVTRENRPVRMSETIAIAYHGAGNLVLTYLFDF